MDFGVAATDQNVGEIGREQRPLRHRQQVLLALGAGDFHQHPPVEHGRAAQQRSGDSNFVVMGELVDQAARRIDEQRQSLGQIGARIALGMRDRAGQHVVEEIDVVGPEAGRALQEQLAEPPRRIGTTLRVACSNDLVEFGVDDQGC